MTFITPCVYFQIRTAGGHFQGRERMMSLASKLYYGVVDGVVGEQRLRVVLLVAVMQLHYRFGQAVRGGRCMCVLQPSAVNTAVQRRYFYKNISRTPGDIVQQ